MPQDKRTKNADSDLDWFTVSYKTIYLIAALLLLLGGGLYYAFKDKKPDPPPLVETPQPSTTSARFTQIEGSVKVRAVGTFEWVSADTKMVLKRNDLIKTGTGSAAEVTFFDGTVVHVRPDSLITIEETSEDPTTRQRRVAWHVSSGEVNFQTVRKNVPGSATEISTPTVRGTLGENAAANIRVAEGGDSDIRLFRGTAKTETKTGQKIDLAANQAVTVNSAGKAGETVSLPATPVLMVPPHETEISYLDPAKHTTLFVWKPVPEASSYHLLVDSTPYFNRPFVDRKGIKALQQEIRGLEEGKYYWKVAAANRDGVEGSFTNFWRFTVTKPKQASGTGGSPPVLTIEMLDVRAQIVQVKGRTEPGASVSVNGQRVDVQADGSFNEFITLEKLGRQVVVIRATGLNGGVAEQKRAIMATY
jgi:hypothetical protein